MYLFSEKIAIRYGVNRAIFMQFLWNILNPERRNEKIRKINGERWYRCSVQMIHGYLPYLSKNQIKRTISFLVENNLLKKGSYNENPFDRTNWYAFTEYGKYLMKEENEK